MGGGHQPCPCVPPPPTLRPFSHAGGARGQQSGDGVRMLQPPAGPGRWAQPLGRGDFLGSPPPPCKARSQGFIISQDLWRKTKS